MRIKVHIDVRKPLKRRKKITKKNGAEVIVTYKYERLDDFCFTCVMSHTEDIVGKFLDKTNETFIKEWGGWLRAPSHRSTCPVKSKWLREEGDVGLEGRVGRVNINPKS